MGWAWRVATGVEWDEAVPAMRAYWQSHRSLILRLLWLLAGLAVTSQVVSFVGISKIAFPWVPDATYYLADPRYALCNDVKSTPLFVAFIAYLFWALPALPNNPADVARCQLLPQRICICLFAALCGLLNAAAVSAAWRYTLAISPGATENTPQWGGSIQVAVWSGITSILVPVLILLGIQGRSPRLHLATKFSLWLWLIVTSLVDLVWWLPVNIDTDLAGLTGEEPLLLGLGIGLTVLLLLCLRRTRAAAFSVSTLFFVATTVCNPVTALMGTSWFYPLFCVGTFGLGRLDRTFEELVSLIK